MRSELALHTAAVVFGLSLMTPAAAQDWIDEWEYDFSTEVHDDFSGHGGWVSGWSGDPWTTAWYSQYREVNPQTDTSGGQWSGNDALTNHLTQESAGPWEDVAIEVQASILDNDTLGLVLRKSAHDTFYLFFMTQDSLPPDGNGGQGDYSAEGAFLYRVEDGVAHNVAQDTGAAFRVDGNDWDYQRLRLEAVGNTIVARYSPDAEGGWGGNTEVLTFTDPSPLPAGDVGLYSYDMGNSEGLVGFRDPLVQLADSDGDGTPNDHEVPGDDDDDDASDDDDDASDDDDDASDDDDDDDASGDDDDASGDDDSAGGDDDDDDDGLALIQGQGCDCDVAPPRTPRALAILALVALVALRRTR